MRGHPGGPSIFMNIYSIIPARAGSKGVSGKNVRLVGGFPLIAFSIIASKLSKHISRTIVSTDSEAIAALAKKFGAEVPFLRPAKFATDKSVDLDVFLHAIEWFEKNEKQQPDLLVQIRTTTPLRNPKLIDEAIDRLIQNPSATGLRSADELAEPPQKMMKLDSKGFLQGFFPQERRQDYYNLPRQQFPVAYHPNGYVDVVRARLVKKTKRLYGNKILGFITPFAIEIDTPINFEHLEYLLTKDKNPVYTYLCKHFKKSKHVQL